MGSHRLLRPLEAEKAANLVAVFRRSAKDVRRQSEGEAEAVAEAWDRAAEFVDAEFGVLASVPQERERVYWEISAALSSAAFVERYVRECCRHTDAVADCPHCNLNFIAGWTRRAATAMETTPDVRPQVDEPLHAGDDERLDLLAALRAKIEILPETTISAEDAGDAADGLLADLEKLDALLVATVKREAAWRAHSAEGR